MNIHEYQAKTLLKDYGAPVADGRVADTPQEAAAIARELGGQTFVVKAQIHAGGRGKGGGIKLVKTLQELHAEADRMLGKPLITPQTGPKGRTVRRVYVVKDTTIAGQAGSPSSPRPRVAWISKQSRLILRKRLQRSPSIRPRT